MLILASPCDLPIAEYRILTLSLGRGSALLRRGEGNYWHYSNGLLPDAGGT